MDGEIGTDVGLMTGEKPKIKGWFMARLMQRYDGSFLFALGMQYFNTGLRQMIVLADNNLWEAVYGLSPTTATMYTSWINLPWSPKLFYGIITDAVPICGSTKRMYVVLMGVLQFVSLMTVAMIPGLDPAAIMGLTVVYSMGGAFTEVVCQGLMVVECRKDPESGSEELQTFAWVMYGVGGTIGCYFGGLFTTMWVLGPGARLCYAIVACFCLTLGIGGFFINKELESNQKDMISMSAGARTKMVFKEIGQGLMIKELYTSLIFQMILSSIVPQFQTFLYYYYTEVTNFSNMTYAYLQLVGNFATIPGAIMFNLFLKEKEFRFMMIMACLINTFGALTTAMFCSNHTLGMTPFLFTMFTSTVTDVLYMCFVNMPLSVLFAKLIPEKIESSLFAFSTGLMNLSNLFISPNLGVAINAIWFHQDTTDLTKVWQLYIVQAVMSVIPIFFVWLLPKRADVTKVQTCLAYIALQDTTEPARIEITTLILEYNKLDEKHVIAFKIKDPRMLTDRGDEKITEN